MIYRLIAVLLTGLCGAAVAATWADSQPERYTAQTVLAIGPSPTIADQADLIDILGSLERSGTPATAAGIATSRSVRDRVASALSLEPRALGDYEIDSIPVPSANLLDITVSGPDPELAAAVADRTTIEVRDEFARIYRIYEITVLTDASVPTQSDRPEVWLVAIGGFVLGSATAVVVLAAIASRRRGDQYDHVAR